MGMYITKVTVIGQLLKNEMLTKRTNSELASQQFEYDLCPGTTFKKDA